MFGVSSLHLAADIHYTILVVCVLCFLCVKSIALAQM